MFIYHDENGAISGVVFGPDKSYGKHLDDLGIQWIFLADQPSIDPSRVIVDVEKKRAAIALHSASTDEDRDSVPNFNSCILPKNTLSVTCDKTTIIADGRDEANIYGVPVGSHVRIDCGTSVMFDAPAQDSIISISSDIVAAYRITISPSNMFPAIIEISAT